MLPLKSRAKTITFDHGLELAHRTKNGILLNENLKMAVFKINESSIAWVRAKVYATHFSNWRISQSKEFP